jgi:hypothetical protein
VVVPLFPLDPCGRRDCWSVTPFGVKTTLSELKEMGKREPSSGSACWKAVQSDKWVLSFGMCEEDVEGDGGAWDEEEEEETTPAREPYLRMRSSSRALGFWMR